MIAGVILGLVIAIMAGAHIATTLTTAKELHSLRQTTKALRGEIDVLKSDNRVLYKQLSAVITHKKNARRSAYPESVPGSLDLYHGGQVARVNAVFHPKTRT